MATRYDFSSSLRVIGQELQNRGIDLFDLRCSDSKFFLQCGATTTPYLELVKFNYSLAQIKALELKAKNRRGNAFNLVNFESMPEVLRAIGCRIDDQGGQLLRAYSSDRDRVDTITIEFQTTDRRGHREELYLTAAADHAMRMYNKRLRDFAT
jgi:hypothetical protein